MVARVAEYRLQDVLVVCGGEGEEDWEGGGYWIPCVVGAMGREWDWPGSDQSVRFCVELRRACTQPLPTGGYFSGGAWSRTSRHDTLFVRHRRNAPLLLSQPC